MTTETLQRFTHATPFLPFVIHLADRREIPVPHRDFIAHAPNTRTVVVTYLDSSVEVIDLLLVTSLKVTSPELTAQREGS
jgi:hypothetical protein